MVEDPLRVCRDESRGQLRTCLLRHASGRVRLLLKVSNVGWGGELANMYVADPMLGEPRLETTTVQEGVPTAPQTTSLTKIREGVYTRVLQRGEEAKLVKAVAANRYKFQCSPRTASSVRVSRVQLLSEEFCLSARQLPHHLFLRSCRAIGHQVGHRKTALGERFTEQF